MNDGSVARLLEHFPNLFDEIDQKCAFFLGLTIDQYEEMLGSIAFRVENGFWDEEKIVDIKVDMCYALMSELVKFELDDKYDCWEDHSFPGEPVMFCAFEMSGKKIMEMYLENVTALLKEQETGDSDAKSKQSRGEED